MTTHPFIIADAIRQNAPVTAAFIGPSGSGKTYSALLFARGLVGLGGRIGVIDTEGKRSLIYADDPKIGGFRHLQMPPPYSPENCSAAFDAAISDGWQAIIFDSASLEHDGEGGLLEMAELEVERLEEEAKKRGRDNRAVSQQKWTMPKLRHRRFLNHVTGLPAHIILTFRQVLTTDFTAKPPTTVLSEVCEKNTKFALELHVFFGADHKATWTRVPEPFRPHIKQGAPVTVEIGAAIANGLGPVSATKSEPAPIQARPISVAAPVAASPDMVRLVRDWMSREYLEDDELSEAFARLGKTLTWSVAQCDWLLSDAGQRKILSLIEKDQPLI